MRVTIRCALAAVTALASLCLTGQGRAEEVVSSYVTFYGFDDNDDGNPAHVGTAIISHAAIHGFADEDLGTYERPGTLAADITLYLLAPKFMCPHWNATM